MCYNIYYGNIRSKYFGGAFMGMDGIIYIKINDVVYKNQNINFCIQNTNFKLLNNNENDSQEYDKDKEIVHIGMEDT